MRVKPIFAWYDLRVGAFYDRVKRHLNLFPVPCIGIRIELAERRAFGCRECNGKGYTRPLFPGAARPICWSCNSPHKPSGVEKL